MAATNPQPAHNKDLWKIVTILILAALIVPALIYTLKGWGIVIALVAAVTIFIAVSNRGAEAQMAPLRRSIELSLDDIHSVLEQWTDFQFSPDSDALADRTFNRRELMNQHSEVDSIAEFHHMVPIAQEVLHSVEERYPHARSTRELTKLLRSTDKVAEELGDLWTRARADARGNDQGAQD